MSSNITIGEKCQYYQKIFLAKTVHTRYCSHLCNSRDYKHRYRGIRFLSFLRRQSGIWENVKPVVLPGYLPFNQAKQYIQKLRIRTEADWVLWSKHEKRPHFIPRHPELVYKDIGWVDWQNWFTICS